MSAVARAQYDQNRIGWDASPVTRYRPVSGTNRNEQILYDLKHVETEFVFTAARQIAQKTALRAGIQKLQGGASPLKSVNRLLKQAGLPIRLNMDSGELRCTNQHQTYSLIRASDGERASILLLSNVVSAVEGTIFLIDEPELHLHKSISVPLIKAIIAERPDCVFIVCTHELDLPPSIERCRVLLLRGCEWQGDQVISWSASLLAEMTGIPEDLRRDIVGARRKILFVEGSWTSLDQPLYAILFPLVSVIPKEDCREVRRAVSGLRSVYSHHEVEPYGLVDNDGLSEVEIDELRRDEVYALPMYSVESLYYCREVREAVAIRQRANFGKGSANLLLLAEEAALNALGKNDQAGHLASLLAHRVMREKALAGLPKAAAMKADGEQVSVTIESPYPEELQRILAFIQSRDLESIVIRYPIRKSGILDPFAQALRFQNRGDYEAAALARIEDTPHLAQQLRNKLLALQARLI